MLTAYPPTSERGHLGFVSTLGLLLVLTVARLTYLGFFCPYDLAPDEAHYWDWSRHLDWSYYSKGPLVAWLIRVSCFYLGDTPFGVRLPAVLCGSSSLLGLYFLIASTLRRPWLAFMSVALVSVFPVVAVGSLLMTIDAPFLCCWIWGLVLAYRAVTDGQMVTWLILGLVTALGFLAKFNMLALPASLFLFLVFSPRHRVQLHTNKFWLMAIVGSLGALPILVWNWSNDWVTLRHVLGQAGAQSQSGWRWVGIADFCVGQAALLLGVGFLFWAGAACWAARRMWLNPLERERPLAFLFWMSVPIFLVFLGFSGRTKIQLNWPLAAYVAGIPLGLAWGCELWCQLSSVKKRWVMIATCILVVSSWGATFILHSTEVVYPLVNKLPITKGLINIRRWDPTCRLRGWKALANEVDQVRKQIRTTTGSEPILAAAYWNLAGEVAFYLTDQPQVYCIARANGGRWSQYDLWRPNPMTDPAHFLGRTFIVVGYMTPGMRKAFTTVTVKQFEYRLHGFLLASWPVTIGVDFQGFECRGDSPY